MSNAPLTALPPGFVPGEHDVVIGKGKKFYFHSGNQWLRTLVASMLDNYKAANTKSDKSNIISEVVEYVRANGRFVKRDLKTGQWAFAEPLLCREKCSQTFRDNLAGTYRSSNVAKRNKRRQEQQEKKRGGPAAGMSPMAAMGAHPAPSDIALEMPQAKRMRTLSLGLGFNPSAGQPQLNVAAAAAAGIPSNLFDLDLDMPSLTSRAQAPAGLTNSFADLSALVSRRGSLAGGFQPIQQQQSFNFNQNSGLNLSSINSGGNNSSTNENLSNLLSSLAQSLNGGNNNAPAPAATEQQTGGFNPFEPTPLNGTGMPPLGGNHSMANRRSSTASFDANAIFGALENVLQQQQQQQQGQGQAPKRHSLAPLMGDDWFRFPAAPTQSNNGQTYDESNISAAFAA